MIYTRPFICHCLDKYEDLIREAKTIEARKFRIDQYLMFKNQLNNYK
jgi:hypothetical protein